MAEKMKNRVLSIRISDEEYKRINDLANFEGINVQSFIRKSMNELYEDAYDYESAVLADKENDEKYNGQTFSVEEAMKELGL